MKFLMALTGLSLLPFSFVTLHLISQYSAVIEAASNAIPDPTVRTDILFKAANIREIAILLTVLFIVLIAVGIYLSEQFFTGEVRTLLSWFRESSARNFKEFTPAPIQSEDEIGQLGRIMQESVVYFQTIEAREKQVLKQKNEFISVAAHQMRTPLTGLHWGIETMLAKDTPSAERAKVGATAFETVERMISIVDDLLEAAKMEEGKYGYNFKKADIVPVLQRIISSFELSATSREVKLALEGPSSLEAYFDSERISTAVSNLVSNAIDYTPPGGSAKVILRERGSRVSIVVSDTGIGIPKSFMSELFNKFSRADNAIHMRPNGSGLGLYLAHNIVERHGSKLELETELGKGTRFSFSIPKSDTDIVPQQTSVEDFFRKF